MKLNKILGSEYTFKNRSFNKTNWFYQTIEYNSNEFFNKYFYNKIIVFER